MARVVTLGLQGWELDEAGLVARARLVLRRAEGEGPVSVDGFGGNVLFTPRQAGTATTPLASMTPGSQEAVVALEVRATRCDPHALIESKRHHVFGFFVTAGSRPSVLVTVAADEPDRDVLQRLAALTCRPGA